MNADLEARLKRLMMFRVVMVTTLLFIATYVEAVSETLLTVNPLYFVIGATYALTVVHVAALRLRAVAARARLRPGARRPADGDGAGARHRRASARDSCCCTRCRCCPRRCWCRGAARSRSRGSPRRSTAACWPRCARACCRRRGSATCDLLPPRRAAVLGVRARRRLRHGGAARLLPGREPAARGREAARGDARGRRPARAQPGDRGQHPERAHDHGRGRPHPVREPLRRDDPGPRRPRACAARSSARCSGRRCCAPAELQTRAASRALARLEISYRHPSGRPLEIGVSVTPLATQEPVRRGCLVVFQDLTEIRRLEEEVRTKEKLAAVGEMAAHLAHEIRNPLGSIRGSAQVLMRRARARRGAGAAARDHLARVEAPLGHAQPLLVPGPHARAPATPGGPAAGRGVGGDAAAQRQRGAGPTTW